MPALDARRPRGFTLIEVIVALAIGSIAILTAGALLTATSDLTLEVSARVGAKDSQEAGEAMLRRLVGQMSWPRPPEPASRFSVEAMRFVSWCDMPAGWQERCIVEIRTAAATDPDHSLSLRLSTGEHANVLADTHVIGFLYLVRAERGGAWAERWDDASSIPPAIGIVTVSDTLIIRIGNRG